MGFLFFFIFSLEMQTNHFSDHLLSLSLLNPVPHFERKEKKVFKNVRERLNLW